MIYRRACATAHQARARAGEHVASGRNERRFREVDAAVETVVLAQAACEGWIHAAYRLAGIDPPQGGWVARWQAAPRSICGRQRVRLTEHPRHRQHRHVVDHTTILTVHPDSGWARDLALSPGRQDMPVHANQQPIADVSA